MLAAAAIAVLVAGGALWWSQQGGTKPPVQAGVEEPRPERASLALLPLENISGDAEQDIFAAGLTEDLNSVLAQVPELMVISQNSMAGFKGKAVKATEVAETLGVGNVLSGTVQRSPERMRITMDLADGKTGEILWSDRYDREPEDLFKVQDEIVREVLLGLQVTLTAGDSARILSRGTENIDAWLLSVRAQHEMFKFTREAVAWAQAMYEEAAVLDPHWSSPLAGQAWAYREAVRRGWSTSVDEDRARGVELVKRSIEMAPDEPFGYILLDNGEYEEGIELREKAIELAPNNFFALAGLAWHLPFVGKEKEALELYRRARKLSPLYPAWLPASEAFALHVAGQHSRAIEMFEEAFGRIDFPILHGQLAAVYAELDEMDKAREQVAIFLQKKPDARISHVMQILRFQGPARTDWYEGLLKKAGVPE